MECNVDDLITTKDENGLNAVQLATKEKRDLVVQILLRRYKIINDHHACTQHNNYYYYYAIVCGGIQIPDRSTPFQQLI